MSRKQSGFGVHDIPVVVDFVFLSATQRDIRKLQREAMVADDARMPDPKKLKYSAVEKPSVSLIKKGCIKLLDCA